MDTVKSFGLSRVLYLLFAALTVFAALFALLNLSAEFSIGGGRPFIRGWVTSVQEPAAAPVLLPHPDGSGDLKVYSYSQPKFIFLEFADMGALLQSRYLGHIFFQKLSWILGILVLYQFTRIFRNLDRGQIFRDENIRRIKFIALAVALVPVTGFAASRMLSGITYTAEGHTVRTAVPVAQMEYIIAGGVLALVILALVEIFRNGVQLQQEQELTI
jgi:hypothetical protein